MKNNQKETTNPQQLNGKTSPIFTSLNVEQQESIIGGQGQESIVGRQPLALEFINNLPLRLPSYLGGDLTLCGGGVIKIPSWLCVILAPREEDQ
jgi:hypothetical protein